MGVGAWGVAKLGKNVRSRFGGLGPSRLLKGIDPPVLPVRISYYMREEQNKTSMQTYARLREDWLSLDRAIDVLASQDVLAWNEMLKPGESFSSFQLRQGEVLLKFVRFGELGVLVLAVKTGSFSSENGSFSANRVVDHLTKTPSDVDRGLPWFQRVTGNKGSIPEREPEKRLPHPRKAAGAQITQS
ncbi:hypothetical protein CPB85DRAFT_1264371 [Mucidula mucida]|nr:hypothetical protein CPB85DRAFT_1264371 [Mucidula mucida]